MTQESINNDIDFNFFSEKKNTLQTVVVVPYYFKILPFHFIIHRQLFHGIKKNLYKPIDSQCIILKSILMWGGDEIKMKNPSLY